MRELKNHAKYTGNARAINAMVELAKSDPDLSSSSDKFDANDYLLTVKNGTIDLTTGEFREHSPADLITKIVDIEYDEKATCPIWIQFLMVIFGKNKKLIEYFQRCVGYTLTGSTEEQCLFFLYGSGANGKSTLLNIIKLLLGQLAQAFPVGALMNRDNRDSHALVRLLGARMAIASESGHDHKLDETLIKQLTGGDIITARQLYKAYIEFYPKFKIWITGNYKPGISGSDHAIWRRIMIIPFDVTIPKDKQDHKLLERLKNELSGILNWALQGCLEWQQQGLNPPIEVTEVVDEHHEDSDPVHRWIKECCAIDCNAQESATDIFINFKNWCAVNNITCGSKIQLGKSLVSKGYKKNTTKTGLYYLGISLNME